MMLLDSLRKFNIDDVVTNFVEHTQVTDCTPVLQALPSQLFGNLFSEVCIGTVSIVPKHPPGCSTLHILQFRNVLRCIRTPGSRGIFQQWSDKCLVRNFSSSRLGQLIYEDQEI